MVPDKFSVENILEELSRHDYDSFSDKDATSYCEEETSFCSDDSESADEADGDNDNVHEGNDDGKQEVAVAAKKTGGGVFVSQAVHNILRRSAGSCGELDGLHTTVQVSQPNRRPSLLRRGSDSDVLHEPQFVYTVQTKSATETRKGDYEKHPFDVLKSILEGKGIPVETRAAQSLKDFWVPWNTDGYTIELTNAIRSNDVDTIRRLHESGNNNLQCSNHFGESIIHTAARRGATEILQYLVHEAGVSLNVCCDSGRNPLHDACWTGQPNFDCIMFLIEACPGFLLMTDKRGLTPLQYAPKDAWEDWDAFLNQYQETLASMNFN